MKSSFRSHESSCTIHKAAILQSAYIPWRGYFDMIAAVDDFIFYDDVQFSNGDWRNRNKIRTVAAAKWLTIPVWKTGRIQKPINEIHATSLQWGVDHWNKVAETYRKAPYFDEIRGLLEPIYLGGETQLSAINRNFIEAICTYLGIKTRLHWSTDFARTEGKSQRLADLVDAVGASVYVSGPAAKNYLDETVFTEMGKSVEWFSYEDLKPYPQFHGGFETAVSIIDLLFNCGPSSSAYLPALKGSGASLPASPPETI